MIDAIAHPRPRIGAAGVIIAGVLAALVAWALIRLAGVELHVGRDSDMDTVGALEVIVASGVAGLAAWGVHYLVAERWNRPRWWPFVGSTALAISINGPGWFADGIDAVALIALHFVVAIVLITGFSWLESR